MIYEVRYSEIVGAYYIRQMLTGQAIKDSYTRMPEHAVAMAVRLSGYETADEWAKAVKEARGRHDGTLASGAVPAVHGHGNAAGRDSGHKQPRGSRQASV